MNIGKNIIGNLYESGMFDAQKFEKTIPYNMRYKETHVESDEDGECLYWITQDFFTEEDIEDFIEVLKNTRFTRAYVTVRDLSSYILNKDIDRKVVVKVDTDGNVEYNNYLEEAKPYLTESAEDKETPDKKEEALKRMEMIKLSSNCINAFKSGKVWESEGPGSLYEVNDEEQKIIDEFESKNKALVYHMIHNVFEFGECWSMFYVSNYPEEWEEDKTDLADGYALVYVYNKDNPEFSEFGSIAFKSNIGGLVRVS